VPREFSRFTPAFAVTPYLSGCEELSEKDHLGTEAASLWARPVAAAAILGAIATA
jgi:hypothetical protein